MQHNFDYETLLLDMHGTFMFGGDNFAPGTDYSRTYHELGGSLPAADVNRIIRRAHEYLSARYADPGWFERFPTVADALEATAGIYLRRPEVARLVQTFAVHEVGEISAIAVDALRLLASRFKVGLVTDIWSPKPLWLRALERHGLNNVFDVMVFSSDRGVVKPSPKAFGHCVDRLRANPRRTVVVGESVERDLGGARAASLDCVLVGGETHNEASANFGDLKQLARAAALSPARLH
ncbi:MAG: HAD family hydrolase [Pseudomonadota bacterium]